MRNRKIKFWEISNSMVLKNLISLVVIFYQLHQRNSKKERMKQNQLDDCKLNILENHGEFNILIKYSVWNIENSA